MLVYGNMTGAAGSGGSGGGGGRYAAEMFNFPLTISPDAPSSPTQGERDGHIWIVCPDADAATIDTIVVDGLDRATYAPGTLLIRVPFFGEDKIYVHQKKQTGKTVLPLSYTDNRSPLENFWPVTVVNDEAITVRMDLGRPWDYAKLFIADTWKKCPLWYFDGETWIAPMDWQYIYWSSYNNAATGEDFRYRAYKIDTDNNFHRGEEIPDFSLLDTVQAIQGSSTSLPANSCSIDPDGLMILGQAGTGFRPTIGIPQRLYAFLVNKRELNYLGKVPLSENNVWRRLEPQVSRAGYKDVFFKKRLVFTQYQTSASATTPSTVCFEYPVYNQETHTLSVKQTNQFSLDRDVKQVVFYSETEGYLCCALTDATMSSAQTANILFEIRRFTLSENDVLWISSTIYSATKTGTLYPSNTSISINVMDGDLLSVDLSGGYFSGSYYTQYATAILTAKPGDNKANTTLKVWQNYDYTQNGGSYSPSNYETIAFQYLSKDRDKAVIRYRKQGNPAIIEHRVYRIQRHPDTNDYPTLTLLSTYSSLGDIPNFNSEYNFWPFMRNLPGPAAREVYWSGSVLQRVNPENSEQVQSIDDWGVGNMSPWPYTSSRINLMISTQLPD